MNFELPSTLTLEYNQLIGFGIAALCSLFMVAKLTPPLAKGGWKFTSGLGKFMKFYLKDTWKYRVATGPILAIFLCLAGLQLGFFEGQDGLRKQAVESNAARAKIDEYKQARIDYVNGFQDRCAQLDNAVHEIEQVKRSIENAETPDYVGVLDKKELQTRLEQLQTEVVTRKNAMKQSSLDYEKAYAEVTDLSPLVTLGKLPSGYIKVWYYITGGLWFIVNFIVVCISEDRDRALERARAR